MSIAATTRGGAVHWNGGNRLGLIGCDGTRCARVVENIRRWHVNNNGWRDIAYNHLVCPGCGTVHLGRGWGQRSAANGTNAANREWHAWMVMFGGTEPFTDIAKAQLLELAVEHRRRYGPTRITTHRAVRGGTTECPGPEAIRWVADGAPAPGTTPPEPEEDIMASIDDLRRVMREENHVDPLVRERINETVRLTMAACAAGVAAIRADVGLPADPESDLVHVKRIREGKPKGYDLVEVRRRLEEAARR